MFDTSAAGHDFNIDNGTFVVDASANRVGIGTASPATPLHITGITTFDGDGASRAEITSSTANSVVSLDIGGFNGTPSVARDIRFLTNAAANAKTERMRISSAGHFIPAADSTYNIGANATRFANAYFDTVYGTLATAAQTNITSVGTLTGLTVGGNVTVSTSGSTALTLSGNFPRLYFVDTAGSDLDAYIVNNANGLFFGKTNSPTASNDIMMLDLTNQRVGIGVSNPAHKLDVEAGANQFDLFRVGSSASDNSEVTIGYFDANAGNGIPALIGSSDFGGLIQGGEHGNLVLGIRDNDATDGIAVLSGGGNFMSDSTYDTLVAKFAANGRVGIGINSPESGLHLYDGTNVRAPQNANRKATLIIEAGSEGSADIQLLNDSYSHIFFGDSADANTGLIWYQHASGGTGADSMHFGTAGDAQRVNIDSSGNVGIGTSSPSDLLSIEGSGNTAVSINTGNNSGDNSQIKFGDSADDDVGQINYDHQNNKFQFRTNGGANSFELESNGNPVFQGTNHTNLQVKAGDNSTTAFLQTVQGSDARFGTSSNHQLNIATNGQFRLSIKNTGEVGIGTTLPTSGSKLDITGGDLIISNKTAAPTNNVSAPGSLVFQGFGWDSNYGSKTIRSKIVHSASYGDHGSGATQGALIFYMQGAGGLDSSPDTLQEGMRLDAGGAYHTGHPNLGINTSNIFNSLHVRGDVGQEPEDTFSVSSGGSTDYIDLYKVHGNQVRGGGRLRALGMENNLNVGYVEYMYAYSRAANGTFYINIKLIDEAYVNNTYARPRFYLTNASGYNTGTNRQTTNQTANSTNVNILRVSMSNQANQYGTFQFAVEPFHWHT